MFLFVEFWLRKHIVKNNGYAAIEINGNFNEIYENNVTGNKSNSEGHGIELRLNYGTSDYNIVNDNIIMDCYYGIDIVENFGYSACSNNEVFGNVITNCLLGIYINGNNNLNFLYHNYLQNNNQNAYDECSNTWDNGYPSGGNFWDDYTGIDADGDGIGDTPYDIPGGSNQDLYPLGYFQSIPPISNFTYSPSSPTVLDVIQFTDTSYDLDGIIVNWTWDFDDGNISYLQNPTNQYTDDGTYLVNLTVMDNDYEYDSLNRLITVTNVPPVADANGPYEGLVGTSVGFHGSATSGTPPYSYYWSFGDGVYSSAQNPSHTYDEEGEYTVSLTVTDDNDISDTDFAHVVIHSPETLVADAGGPYSEYIGDTIQFSGSAIGGSEPYSWYWEFGDGSTSTIQNPTHTYTTVDDYTATLTVTDTYGKVDDDTAMVTINTHPPNKPEITGPISGKAGEEYDYTFSSVDPDGDAVQFYIEWGDGNSEWTGFNSSGDSLTRSHIWDEKDTYIIRAKAKDSNDAESDWATLEVSMPRNNIINLFERFLENHPHMFPLLQQLLGL